MTTDKISGRKLKKKVLELLQNENLKKVVQGISELVRIIGMFGDVLLGIFRMFDQILPSCLPPAIRTYHERKLEIALAFWALHIHHFHFSPEVGR